MDTMIPKSLLKKQSKNQLNQPSRQSDDSESSNTKVWKWRSKKQLNKQLNEPSESGQSDYSKSSAILAFRTITTMLSLIPSPGEVTITGQKDISDAQRKELRVLDALSSVIVRNYEVAAVVAKRHNGPSIQVLLSANESSHITPQPRQHSGSNWNPLRWFMVTPNPRDPARNPKDKIDSLTTQNALLTLVDPNIEISKALSKANPENLLKTFLQTEWGNESFDTHIWMLKTLIGRSQSDDLRTLSLYVISASFPKMLRRLRGARISKRYFDCLLSLKSMTFGFIKQPDIATTNNKNPDRYFLDIIPSLKPGVIDTDISNLRQMVEDVKTPCEIYNENTYMEFHGLLCELLDRFYNSLKKLKTVQTEMISAGHVNLEKTMLELTSVLLFGRYLRAMTRSAAIEKHLKTIANAKLLDLDDGKSSTVTTDEDAEDDEEAEFHVLKPYSIYKGRPILPWQSYKDWLRLTTMYFDAVAILRDHIHTLKLSFPLETNIDIDIKILAPSLPDQNSKMLPWKELLRHKIYFPELLDDPQQPSSEDLISFLTSSFDKDQIMEGTDNERADGINGKKGKGTLVKKHDGVGIDLVVKTVRNLVNQQELVIAAEGNNLDDLTKTINDVIKQVKSLNNCASPGWSEYTATILDQLLALKDHSLTPRPRLTLSMGILEMLETLREHSSLYQKLKDDTPLSCGDSFLGTRHCEVCIASLSSLSGQPGSYDNSGLGATILSEFAKVGQTIGVSKRCCPVCARLLKLLKTHDGERFITTEEHSTFTPCTLPEWLPRDVMEKMVMEFGVRLRIELVKLQKRTEVLRCRTSSTDTRRISLDSMAESELEVFDDDSIKLIFQNR